MKQHATIATRVVEVEQVTPLVKRFRLAAANGSPLPLFTGGSHVIVHMRNGDNTYRNAYSLMGSPDDTETWQIAVRREEHSKGGSAFMHERVEAGSVLEVSPPSNLFALAPGARSHMLIAGGIGITPFLSQLHELQASGADYTLHYACRSPEHAAFAAELLNGPHRERVRLHVDSLDQALDVRALIASLDADTHVYVCGPAPLIDAVVEAAQQRGMPPQQVHREQFAATRAGGGAFTVVLARSGQEIAVAEGVSILEAIERQSSIEVECLCREGVCGTCEARIVEGEAVHCDQYLSTDEKAAQR
ncbi:MAG TPA: PDR/VanB family oxidoreductase, partial [Paraburkholderia sp.]|nr:PDR/VanB family oxidoreductase [Paraburkholderia sp.]